MRVGRFDQGFLMYVWTNRNGFQHIMWGCHVVLSCTVEYLKYTYHCSKTRVWFKIIATQSHVDGYLITCFGKCAKRLLSLLMEGTFGPSCIFLLTFLYMNVLCGYKWVMLTVVWSLGPSGSCERLLFGRLPWGFHWERPPLHLWDLLSDSSVHQHQVHRPWNRLVCQ